MCHDGRAGMISPAADPALDCYGHYHQCSRRCLECNVAAECWEEKRKRQ